MVDTALQNARLARKREHDSLSRIVDLDIEALRGAIVRYAHALESGNVATMKAAYPAMTQEQEGDWKNFFVRAEKVNTSIRYGASKIQRDSADADFTLLLNVVTRDSRESVSPLRQHAKLVRQGGGWQIVSLKGA